MANPKIINRNILSLAKDGRGDGTVYAYGSSAVVDVDAKTFDLSTITFIAEVTEGDDVLIGYELVFTATGNTYLITDYVASTDVAMVKDTPVSTDTGAYEVRRTLFTDDFHLSYPVRRLADGRRGTLWKDGSANHTADIVAALPNAIDDGGFERNSLSDNWTTFIDGDGSISVNSSSPILGSYDCVIDMGTTANEGIMWTPGKIDLKKGKTYGVLFKGRHSGTGTKENEAFLAVLHAEAGNPLIPVTWTKINDEDDIVTVPYYWLPDIEGTDTWEEATFVCPEDIDAERWVLVIGWNDVVDRYNFIFDEVWLYEVVQPDAFIMAEHNLGGGFANPSFLQGCRCQPGRSNFGSGDFEYLIDLDADIDNVYGGTPIYEEFTKPTALYPVFRVYIYAASGRTWEASEIWVGETWEWDRPPNRILTDKEEEVSSNQSYSRARVAVGELLADYRHYPGGEVHLVTPAEAVIWRQFKKDNGHGAPFWLVVPEDTGLGQDEEIVFMRCPEAPRIMPDLPGYFRVTFNFEEALGG